MAKRYIYSLVLIGAVALLLIIATDGVAETKTENPLDALALYTMATGEDQKIDNICELLGISNSDNKVKVKICQVRIVNKENNVEIDIAFAIPKGKRFHFLIQKCTELGVHKLIPLHYERSVVKFKSGHSEKIEKWRKIAIEALKQCGRSIITEISDVMDYGDVLKNVENYDLSLFACNQSGSGDFKNILGEYQKINSIIVFIGSEGGFTPGEIEAAKEAGCKFASLGQRTL